MKLPLKLQPFALKRQCENASVLADAWNRLEQLWRLNVMDIFMHPEFLIFSKHIGDSVRAASRLLQVGRGNMMIATDLPTDSICHLL